MAIAVALHNANLIRMLGVLEAPLGLVMELVGGRPLAEKPNFDVRAGPGLSCCLLPCCVRLSVTVCAWEEVLPLVV